MKFLIFLSFLIISSVVFISCLPGGDCENSMGYNGCITYEDCTNKSDCKNGYFCNMGVGKCYPNPCNDDDFSNCGLGKCVVDDYGNTSCECDEGASLIDEGGRCLLNCNSHQDCSDFKPNGDVTYSVCSDTVNGGVCNLSTCHGDNSCPKDMTCNESKHRCE